MPSKIKSYRNFEEKNWFSCNFDVFCDKGMTITQIKFGFYWPLNSRFGLFLAYFLHCLAFLLKFLSGNPACAPPLGKRFLHHWFRSTIWATQIWSNVSQLFMVCDGQFTDTFDFRGLFPFSKKRRFRFNIFTLYIYDLMFLRKSKYASAHGSSMVVWWSPVEKPQSTVEKRHWTFLRMFEFWVGRKSLHFYLRNLEYLSRFLNR